jgi:uncharacterized protein YacL
VRLALRVFGLVVGILLGWQTGSLLNLVGDDSRDAQSNLLLMALAAGGIGYVLGPHVSWAVVDNVRQAVRSASAVDIVAVGVGLAFGGIISALLAVHLSALPDPLGSVLPLVVAIAACALAIMITLLRKRDLIAPWVRTRPAARPLGEPGAPAPAPLATILLDTSVVIDGRIVDLVQTGFLDSVLAVPRFVLEELQRIADADDPQRRVRGRRGLETLNRLRQDRPEQIVVLDLDVPEAREVDAKLVRLAQARDLRILTNDYNLGRVAELQGVGTLNLNELAGALRPPVLPGEELRLRLVQEGREAGQGVGFLDDGTMVVVDGGKPWVGQQTSVTVTRLLQTGAGRMVFAVPKHAPASTPS